MHRQKLKVIVIGGVACGPKAAARIKRLNPDAEVTIIEKGELLSYAGCGLPFYISGEIHDYKELMCTPTGVVRDTHYFKMVKDITVLNQTLVESIDRKNKTVRGVNIITGKPFELHYEKLVLATGGQPVAPPIKGIDLKGINFLSTVEDARKIRDEEKNLKGKNAVIIGGGLIGVEVTESFVKQGMNVTLIEKMDSVLPALLDSEIAYHVHNELQSNGVTLVINDTVVSINGDDMGNVKSVSTESKEFPADLVLIAIGTRPNAILAMEAALATGKTGGIVVNEFLQTSDPDILAGGDCVENTNLITGKPIFAPMGSTANKHGRVIADNICGRKSSFKGVIGTAICKVFNMNIARTGLTEKQAIEEGYDYITVLNAAPDRAHYHPDAKLIIIKLIVDKKSRKILGAQIIGPGDVAKRIEVVITTITNNATIDDLAYYDLAYAPPFSPAIDNILVTAHIAQNKLDGITKSITPSEVKLKIDNNEDFILLDVRSPQEFEQMRIDDPRVQLIPLGKLRELLHTLNKNKEIITFCKISLRGYEAQRILQGAGFKNVKFLDGGVICWPYKKIVTI